MELARPEYELELLFMEVSFPVALRAKGDQIVSEIVAQQTPRLNVMDLQIFH